MFRSKFGLGSFSVVAPKMYDQFAQSVECFKALLKTFLFRLSLHELVKLDRKTIKVIFGVKS